MPKIKGFIAFSQNQCYNTARIYTYGRNPGNRAFPDALCVHFRKFHFRKIPGVHTCNKEGMILSTLNIVLIVIAVVLLAAIIALYFLGKRAQKKQEEQQEQIAAASQSVSMLIIDKKKLKLKDAGLPAAVLAQTPKLMRRTKMPIVKAKVGPKVMTFICDAAIFDSIPVKREVKAVISGLYITSVRGLHGTTLNAPTGKKSFRQKLQEKYKEASAELEQEKAQKEKKKKK